MVVEVLREQFDFLHMVHHSDRSIAERSFAAPSPPSEHQLRRRKPYRRDRVGLPSSIY
jgi:hypothetical protein